MSFKKFDIVEIRWIDNTFTLGWQQESVINTDDKLMQYKSVGYFYKETKLAWIIFQSMSLNLLNPTFFAITRIPKVVAKIKKL